MADFDLIIIGAGPAGLSAAQYAARSMLSVLVLEHLAPGGQALTIDSLENYPGVMPAKNGFDFIDDMHKQAENFGAKFLIEGVDKIVKEENTFKVYLNNNEVKSTYTIILATGAKYRTLDVPGEKELHIPLFLQQVQSTELLMYPAKKNFTAGVFLTVLPATALSLREKKYSL